MSREEEKNDIVAALKELRTITNKVCDVFCSVDEGFLSEIISGLIIHVNLVLMSSALR